MGIKRRELLGYAVAGTTGMGITAAAETYRNAESDAREADRAAPDGSSDTPAVGRSWRLGGVSARPAEISDTAITFRGSVESEYDTDYEVAVGLYYRPKRAGESWRKIGEETGPLSEGVYLEATETGLETGTTYEYRAEAALTNHRGQSRRVSEVRAVTAGDPCSGPSTNCLRAETLPADASGGGVTLRGRARGLDSYDAVTGHFFYRREGENEQWTDHAPIGSGSGDDEEKPSNETEFSTVLSDLPAGTYTYYAEVRGEGGDWKNMYAEGEKRRFAVE